ncbi:MAG: tetratricopeptide repeat protein [Acidobacteria bacterium]|nr:tetratricopeptide repeat protein [Acidobacteriota bacterium]
MKAEARHKMKEDEFVSLFTRATHAVAGNPRQTLTALLVLLLLAAAFVGLKYYKDHQNALANEAFVKGMTSYSGMRLDVPPQGDAKPAPDYAAALASFEQVADYRLAGLKEPARLMAAVAEAKLGHTQEAETRLKAVAEGGGNTFYARMAKLQVAENLYQQGKYAEAATAYTAIAQTNDPNFPTDYAMMALGIAQQKAGDRAAAVTTFKKLAQQFPESTFAQKAQDELRRIAPDEATE